MRIYKPIGKILQAAFATKADAAFCFSPIGNKLREKISLAQVYTKYRYNNFYHNVTKRQEYVTVVIYIVLKIKEICAIHRI